MLPALVAALVAASVLVGVAVRQDSDGSRTIQVGTIDAAQARAIAVDALRDASDLVDVDVTTVFGYRALDDTHAQRVHGTRVVRIGDDRRFVNWNTASPPMVRRSTERLVVDGNQYVPTVNRRFVSTPWMLDLRYRDGAIGYGSERQPDVAAIAKHLESEGRIDAHREHDGTVTIHVARPARDLAPIDGAAVVPEPQDSQEPFDMRWDPIMMMAMTALHAPGNVPNPMVEVDMRIAAGGALSELVVRTQQPMTLMGNGLGGKRRQTEMTLRMSWKQPEQSSIVAPPASDVTVAGNVMRARREGDIRGIAGLHGTLDTITPERLEQLRHRAQRAPFWAGGTPPANTRPTRQPPSTTRYVGGESQHRRAFKRIMARVRAMDLAPASLASHDWCSPYWPATGRSMTRDAAMKDPETAGWLCRLPDARASFAVAPGVETRVTYNYSRGGAMSQALSPSTRDGSR